MILDVCAENLPRHTMPASIDILLRPDEVGRELPRGGGAAVVPPGGFAIKIYFPLEGRRPNRHQRSAGA